MTKKNYRRAAEAKGPGRAKKTSHDPHRNIGRWGQTEPVTNRQAWLIRKLETDLNREPRNLNTLNRHTASGYIHLLQDDLHGAARRQRLQHLYNPPTPT